MGTKHPGKHPEELVTKTSLVKLLESSLAEKDVGVLMDTKLTRSQQGALAIRAVSGILGCTRQSIASSWGQVTLPLCAVLCPGLGSPVRSYHGHTEESHQCPSPHITTNEVRMGCCFDPAMAPVPTGTVLCQCHTGDVRLLPSSTGQHWRQSSSYRAAQPSTRTPLCSLTRASWVVEWRIIFLLFFVCF